MMVRIIERIRQDGSKNYVIQKRFLWIWWDCEEYGDLKDAKKKLCFYDGTKVVERVVSEATQREPDPATAAVVRKLREIFKERLEREDDPDAFLRGIAPNVVHERRDWLPYAVNEAPGKLYIFDNPVRWGMSILVDGEFAEKVLALGELPN